MGSERLLSIDARRNILPTVDDEKLVPVRTQIIRVSETIRVSEYVLRPDT
jgi:hypothetical protein